MFSIFSGSNNIECCGLGFTHDLGSWVKIFTHDNEFIDAQKLINLTFLHLLKLITLCFSFAGGLISLFYLVNMTVLP